MRLLFACQSGSTNFAEPYLRYLDHDRIVDRHASARIHRQAAEYDVLWVEWANAFAERLLTSHPDAYTVLRVHDWEIRTGRVKNFDYDNVDMVWFINPDAQADFLLMTDVPADKTMYMPNAVDLNEWPMVAHGEKHIGILTANIQPRKNLDAAFELMTYLAPEGYQLTLRTSKAAHRLDPKGPNRIQAYADRLNSEIPGCVNIEWRTLTQEDLLNNTDVIEFWRDKSHSVSVAKHEGFCYALAEAMACGAAACTLEWEWGKPGLFYDNVAPTIPELANLIRTTSPGADNRIKALPFSAAILAGKLEQFLESKL